MKLLVLLFLSRAAIVMVLDPASYLQAHNTYRRNVRPRAANMKKLKWSEELAAKAQNWALQCLNEPDPVTSLPSVTYVGENHYLGYGSPTASNVVSLWTSQSYNYIYSSDSCSRVASCDDYKQVVWADTEYLGCAEQRCQAGTLVVCNYGPGAKPNGQPYIDGFPCASCPPGYSCEIGLCK